MINLKHFSQYIAFSSKAKEDWGNSCQHICLRKESNLTDYNSFSRFIWKVFSFKSYDFFKFLSLYRKCRKSLTIKTTLMSLNWVIMDQTMRKFTQPRNVTIGHFTVMDGSEADGDLVLVQTFLLYYVNQVILMLSSIFQGQFP